MYSSKIPVCSEDIAMTRFSWVTLLLFFNWLGWTMLFTNDTPPSSSVDSWMDKINVLSIYIYIHFQGTYLPSISLGETRKWENAFSGPSFDWQVANNQFSSVGQCQQYEKGLRTPMMLIVPFIIGIYAWKSGHTYHQLIAVTMINI